MGRAVPSSAARSTNDSTQNQDVRFRKMQSNAVTGHWPHWVKVEDTKADQWFVQAYNNSDVNDGTYEAIGPHFQGNPYQLEKDILMPHGKEVIQVERTFDGIKKQHHILV